MGGHTETGAQLKKPHSRRAGRTPTRLPPASPGEERMAGGGCGKPREPRVPLRAGCRTAVRRFLGADPAAGGCGPSPTRTAAHKSGGGPSAALAPRPAAAGGSFMIAALAMAQSRPRRWPPPRPGSAPAPEGACRLRQVPTAAAGKFPRTGGAVGAAPRVPSTGLPAAPCLTLAGSAGGWGAAASSAGSSSGGVPGGPAAAPSPSSGAGGSVELPAPMALPRGRAEPRAGAGGGRRRRNRE